MEHHLSTYISKGSMHIRLFFTFKHPEKSHIFDLGAGEGLFTRALSLLLPPGSNIVAVDKTILQQPIRSESKDVLIEQSKLNFIADTLPGALADGILMANSLHFVEDKNGLLQKLRKCVYEEGRIIIVEYDTDRGNKWVPYPITYSDLKSLVFDVGFKQVEKIAETPSMYGNRQIYSAVIHIA